MKRDSRWFQLLVIVTIFAIAGLLLVGTIELMIQIDRAYPAQEETK